MVAITSDSAGNNGTLAKILEARCQNLSIDFKAKNHHVRCLAHVLNIAVQVFLTELKEERSKKSEFDLAEEDLAELRLEVFQIEDDDDEAGALVSVVRKVYNRVYIFW